MPLIQDLKVARRSLFRQPGIWVLALIALTVGLGVNATVYAFMRAVFERPFSTLSRPGTVILLADNSKQGRERHPLTSAEFLYLREHARAYSMFAASDSVLATLGSAEATERIEITKATSNFLDTIGGSVQLGRWFTANEEKRKVAVLSATLWRDRFSRDPNVLGKTVRIDGEPHEIIGVGSDDLWWPSDRIRAWTPLEIQPGHDGERLRNLDTLAVSAAGVSLAQANDELQRILPEIARQHPASSTGWNIRAWTPLEGTIDPGNRIIRPLFQTLALSVLLLTCANIANLLLARSAGRRREFAIRKAMGGGVGSIAKLIFAEGIWLAIPAVILSALIAQAAVKALFAGIPTVGVPLPEQPIDALTLAILGALTLVTIGGSLLPSLWQGGRLDLASAMRSSGVRAGATAGHRRWTQVFTGIQAAMAMSLLVVGLFLAKGTYQEIVLDLGFDARNIVEARISLPTATYKDPARITSFLDQAVARAASTTGVEQTAVLGLVPQIQGNGPGTGYFVDGQEPEPDNRLPQGNFFAAGPGAIETLRISMLQGRRLERTDTATSTPVTWINQTAATRLWPKADPIGKRVRLTGLDNRWFSVAGIFHDIRRADPTQAVQPQFIVPLSQAPVHALTLVARTAAPDTVSSALRLALRAVDLEVPVQVETLDAETTRNRQGQLTLMTLVWIMAGLSLFLASVGLFSLLAYQLQQQTRDIGVRIALGAAPRDIRFRVLYGGAKVVLPGLVIGAGLALILTRALAPMLYGMKAIEPLVLAVSFVLLIAAMGWATLTVASRAAATDPIVALRED